MEGKKILCRKERDHCIGKGLEADLGFYCSLTSQLLNSLSNEMDITLLNRDIVKS